MLDLRKNLIICFLLIAPVASAFSQNGERTPTNLDVIRSLAQQVTVKILKQTEIETGENLDLSIFPKQSAWYIESAVMDGVKSLGLNLRQDTTAPVAAVFALGNARVEYSNVRKDGLFGPKLVDRNIEIQLSSKLVRRQTGSILWASDEVQSVLDTIELSDVPRLENQTVPITLGILPREGFFSNLAEPLILLGAIAVAVFLLFNVRS